MAKSIVISCRLCQTCMKVIPEGPCRECKNARNLKYRNSNKALINAREVVRRKAARQATTRRERGDITAEEIRGVLEFNPETGAFNRPGKIRTLGVLREDGYLRISMFGLNLMAHRLAWLHVHGEWPNGQIDHINGVRSDNRIANLRVVTNSVNNQNLRGPKSHNKSGFLGVLWDPKSRKWIGRITVAGKAIVLGRFDQPQDASAAYIEAKRKLHQGCTL